MNYDYENYHNHCGCEEKEDSCQCECNKCKKSCECRVVNTSRGKVIYFFED